MSTFTDLLGTILQEGLSLPTSKPSGSPAPSTMDRLKDMMGSGGAANKDDLGNLLKNLGLDTGSLGDILGGLGGLFGGGGQGGEGAGIGQTISSTLEEAQKAIGSDKKLALGALGALLGAVLGGGSQSMKGAVGGGLLAVLGALAYQALKGTSQEPAEVPTTLKQPETPAEKAKLENQAQLVLKAMINAAKADGQIDQGEVQRILSKLDAAGADAAARDFILTEMTKPMETEAIVAAATGNPQLAAELYAASLLAIKVDTPAEQEYMNALAGSLGLAPQAVANLQNTMGLLQQ
jgi:uncharacterized membrane protein YebE (DUF533 family)